LPQGIPLPQGTTTSVPGRHVSPVAAVHVPALALDPASAMPKGTNIGRPLGVAEALLFNWMPQGQTYLPGPALKNVTLKNGSVVCHHTGNYGGSNRYVVEIVNHGAATKGGCENTGCTNQHE